MMGGILMSFEVRLTNLFRNQRLAVLATADAIPAIPAPITTTSKSYLRGIATPG